MRTEQEAERNGEQHGRKQPENDKDRRGENVRTVGLDHEPGGEERPGHDVAVVVLQEQVGGQSAASLSEVPEVVLPEVGVVCGPAPPQGLGSDQGDCRPYPAVRLGKLSASPPSHDVPPFRDKVQKRRTATVPPPTVDRVT